MEDRRGKGVDGHSQGVFSRQCGITGPWSTSSQWQDTKLGRGQNNSSNICGHQGARKTT